MKPIWELYDLHKGAPGVLICNGPSLADVPNDFIKKYFSMGSNSVYVKDNILVDYYVIEGVGHLKKEEERLARMPYVKKVGNFGGATFVQRRLSHWFCHLPNVYPVDYRDYNNQVKHGWSFEPFDIYATGACVTYAMLQFMFAMGFDPVLIVGMDHKFDGGSWHFYPDSDAPEFESMPQDEYQRFRARVDPNFQIAANVYKSHSRTLLNLTPGSAAKMFETDKLENWL